MKKRIKLSKWAELNDYTYHGAFIAYQRGGIPGAFKSPSGSILVEIDEKVLDKPDYVVVYSRVSSSENRSNLDSQADRVSAFCNAKGWVVEQVIKECASGLNDNRPKLLKILNESRVTKIVVEHKDRLTRFGFNYIKTLFPGEIIVINKTNETNSENELMQDFVSLVTSFCARLYGRRRTKRKTEELIKKLNEENEERKNN